MYLIEIFLPVADAEGSRFPHAAHATTRDELVAQFGGLTAHSQAPVAGLWEDAQGNVVKDDLVVYEVVAERLKKAWWAAYRKTLEQRFKQSQLLVRASEIELL